MGVFYKKIGREKYVPVEFRDIATSGWNDKLVVVRVGSDTHPAKESEVEETLASLEDADALNKLKNTSFLITLHEIDFKILGNPKEIRDQCVAVYVKSGEDLSKLGNLQKQARQQLREKSIKATIVPTPLTVDQYKEVMEVKRRCDTRRNRRGK